MKMVLNLLMMEQVNSFIKFSQNSYHGLFGNLLTLRKVFISDLKEEQNQLHHFTFREKFKIEGFLLIIFKSLKTGLEILMDQCFQVLLILIFYYVLGAALKSHLQVRVAS